jgi:phage regulator Rha-like protein
MYLLINSEGKYLTFMYQKEWFTDSREIARIFDNHNEAVRIANIKNLTIVTL